MGFLNRFLSKSADKEVNQNILDFMNDLQKCKLEIELMLGDSKTTEAINSRLNNILNELNQLFEQFKNKKDTIILPEDLTAVGYFTEQYQNVYLKLSDDQTSYIDIKFIQSELDKENSYYFNLSSFKSLYNNSKEAFNKYGLNDLVRQHIRQELDMFACIEITNSPFNVKLKSR